MIRLRRDLWNAPESQDRLNLVFAARFQEYGAFQLRRQHNKRMVISMLITALLFGGFAAGPLLFAKPSPPVLNHYEPPRADTTWMKTEESETVKHTAGKRSGNSSTGKSSSIPEPDPDFLQSRVAPGDPGSRGGTDYGGDDFGGRDTGTGTGSGIPDDKIYPPGAPDYREARYIGGSDAFRDWVQNQFRAPESCTDTEEGYVKLKFVVNQNGSVSAVSVIESGPGCPEYEEAVKAILTQSREWIPASVNGHFVRSWCEVTIRLRLF